MYNRIFDLFLKRYSACKQYDDVSIYNETKFGFKLRKKKNPLLPDS